MYLNFNIPATNRAVGDKGNCVTDTTGCTATYINLHPNFLDAALLNPPGS